MAIVKKYKAKIEKIDNPLEDIYTITFSSDKKFKYQPGQFLHLALDDFDGIGQWPESRCFSMQSNPNEDLIKITYAVKGIFTKRMVNELIRGKEVWLKMPYGDLFQRNHYRNNCIFIAGGTGHTPFLSLFSDKSFHEYSHPILFQGFKNKEFNIFTNDIELAVINNSQLKVYTFYENITGILNIEDIYNLCGDSTYFLSGPPQMIKNFKNYLMNVSQNKSIIITDDWE